MSWFTKLIELIISWFKPGPPKAGLWKCPMFFQWKICGTNNNPPWPGNRGVDSNQGYASDHGMLGENEKRINGYKWVQAYGGDTTMFIAERLYGHDIPHLELQMFLTNRLHPDGSRRMNDAENWVVKARAYGIQRWVVSLINNPDSIIPVNLREDYVHQMATCYEWATKEQVAFLIGLECSRNLSVAEVVQLATWVNFYAPGKRIIVGDATNNFLIAVANAIKAQNAKPENKDKQVTIELWSESDCHPFDLQSIKQADEYLNKLKDLQRYGKVWAGEWGDGCNMEIMKYITPKSLAAGYDCGCGWFKS
jgi:hypothetical protein